MSKEENGRLITEAIRRLVTGNVMDEFDVFDYVYYDTDTFKRANRLDERIEEKGIILGLGSIVEYSNYDFIKVYITAEFDALILNTYDNSVLHCTLDGDIIEEL